MKVAIPHDLGREEVRRRLRERSHEIGDHIPGGMAEVATTWRSEDVMAIDVKAMGQRLHGDIEIEDNQLIFQIDLPPMLSFIKPMIESAIRSNAPRLLEKK